MKFKFNFLIELSFELNANIGILAEFLDGKKFSDLEEGKNYKYTV
jgi:hypothetical protein